MTTGNFKSDRHALYVGWVVGQLNKHRRDVFTVSPMVDEDGDYIADVTMDIGGESIVLTVPEPPEEWVLE